ncbi:unnamed protein product [Ectocarpus sp. 12 AP-2014]
MKWGRGKWGGPVAGNQKMSRATPRLGEQACPLWERKAWNSTCGASFILASHNQGRVHPVVGLQTCMVGTDIALFRRCSKTAPQTGGSRRIPLIPREVVFRATCSRVSFRCA